MNDLQIETLLKRAPQPRPPAGLLEDLQREIALPKAAYRNGDRPNLLQSSLRRWLPTFAFGLIIMSCLVIAGMQANVAAQLKKQNEELRANTPDLEQLRFQHRNYDKFKDQQQELEQLRADNQDLQRLREEIARLRPIASQILRLRAENEQLATNLRSLKPAFAHPNYETDADPENANSAKCINNLKQIGLAVRTWGLDNQGFFPTAILQMTNELSTPMILFCPSDPGKPSKVLGWSDFPPNSTARMTSYQFILSGDQDDIHPRRIICKCPIHGHVLTSDGAVHAVADTIREGQAREVTVDGRLELE